MSNPRQGPARMNFPLGRNTATIPENDGWTHQPDEPADPDTEAARVKKMTLSENKVKFLNCNSFENFKKF